MRVELIVGDIDITSVEREDSLHILIPKATLESVETDFDRVLGIIRRALGYDTLLPRIEITKGGD